MSICNNYIMDSDYHLTIHCLKRGLVSARVCMGCKNRQQSNTRNCIDYRIKEEKEDVNTAT